jgi:hypothetical protein
MAEGSEVMEAEGSEVMEAQVVAMFPPKPDVGISRQTSIQSLPCKVSLTPVPRNFLLGHYDAATFG